MPKATIYIRPDGLIEHIYTDLLVGLGNKGESKVSRASHVEPSRDQHGNNCWVADMSPSSGPELGPFYTRQEALDAEVEWLHVNKFKRC